MPTDRQLTITLPEDLTANVRSKVASGEYATENEVVLDAIRDYFSQQDELDGWLRREVLSVLDEMDADSSLSLTSEDMHLAIAAEAAALRKQSS